MLSNLRVLFFAILLTAVMQPAFAQKTDYLKHGKVFCMCSIKHECFGCFSCEKDRYLVKMENRSDKKIKGISFEFYSDVYNKILEKTAKIEGGVIDPHETGLLHVCVPDGMHWIISRIEYTDDSEVAFTLHERLGNYKAEKDECDCNP